MGATTSDWRSKADALIQAARDVRNELAPRPSSKRVGPRHRKLFDQYVKDLRRAQEWALSWWTSMIRTELQATPDQRDAERNVSRRNPVGPVAHVGVIYVLRRYWLDCVALNREVPAAEQVQPEDFLLGFLLYSSYGDLGRFVAQLPYWPIGLDADGNWI